jgi:predicted phage replisome organizer
MSVNKKYFYLKLKDNFFDTDEMIILESMQDGYKYSNILLKLYLRSLKNEGKLMVNDRIPFNSTMLASVTRHSVGDIEKAVAIFKDLGLIEVLDNGAIYMSDIQNFIGHLSSEGERKKEYRLKISKESGTLSQKCPDIRPPEKELELEKEIYKGKPSLVDAYALEDTALTEQGKEILNRFTAYRKSIKAPIKTTAPLKAFITTLRNAMKQGYKIEEIINLMESKEWQTIKLEWIAKELTAISNNQAISSSTDVQGLMKNLRIPA